MLFEDWRDDLGTETGYTSDGGYDVRKAKKILKVNNRDFAYVELAQFADLLKQVAGTSYSGIDYNVPIILIPVGERLVPIDGWSRIMKATQEGLSTLRAVILTEEEKEEIRI